MKVLTHSTPVALWQEIVHEAEAACETTLQHELEAYLVFLLSRYINKPEIAKLTMATELMQALQSSRTTRDAALQGVGDTCLLFSGLFPKKVMTCMICCRNNLFLLWIFYNPYACRRKIILI
jgi:hypothetical protein